MIVQFAENDPAIMAKITAREVHQTKEVFGDHGCAKCHNVDGGGSTRANLNRKGLSFREMNLGCVDMMFSLADPFSK